MTTYEVEAQFVGHDLNRGTTVVHQGVRAGGGRGADGGRPSVGFSRTPAAASTAA